MVLCLLIAILIFSCVALLLEDVLLKSLRRKVYLVSGYVRAHNDLTTASVARALQRIPPIVGVALLLRTEKINRGLQKLSSHLGIVDLGFSLEQLLSLLLYQGASIAFMAGVLFKSLLAALLIPLSLIAFEFVLLDRRRERVQYRLKEGIPDTVRSLSSCLSAGLSLAESLAVIAKEAPASLRPYFYQASCAFEQGYGSSEALNYLDHAECKELSYLALALRVQHKTGGNMQGILDSVLESTTAQLELERSQRAQTAQAQLSARLVFGMPFALLILFSIISPGFLDSFTESLLGMLIFSFALLLQAAGMFIIYRLVHERGLLC